MMSLFLQGNPETFFHSWGHLMQKHSQVFLNLRQIQFSSPQLLGVWGLYFVIRGLNTNPHKLIQTPKNTEIRPDHTLNYYRPQTRHPTLTKSSSHASYMELCCFALWLQDVHRYGRVTLSVQSLLQVLHTFVVKTVKKNKCASNL